MVDLGEGTPLIWVKQEEMIKGTKASRASKSTPTLVQGLDTPLKQDWFISDSAFLICENC